MDHFVPNKDIKSAQHCKCVREFACKNEISNYFDVGEMGIEHALLPEKGLTVAGDVIIGADSHTFTNQWNLLVMAYSIFQWMTDLQLQIWQLRLAVKMVFSQ